jgi:hypothetical protein
VEAAHGGLVKAWRSTRELGMWAWVSVALLVLAACAPVARAGRNQVEAKAAVPGPVTLERVGPGGGSGEIVVRWHAVPGATGYRVLRSETRCGPFEVVADFDVTTGRVSADEDVVNIWSAEHSYIPRWEPFTGADRSSWFEYVEISRTGERCFEVMAFNQAGDGPASPVACGSPP